MPPKSQAARPAVRNPTAQPVPSAPRTAAQAFTDLLASDAFRTSADLLSSLSIQSGSDALVGLGANRDLTDLLIGSSPRLSTLDLAPPSVDALTDLSGASPVGASQFATTGLLLAPKLSSLDTSLVSSYDGLSDELMRLRKQVADQTRELTKKQRSEAEQKRQLASLLKSRRDLDEKFKLAFVLSRVSKAAQQKLLSSKAFRKNFLSTGECNAFVLAVDIRRSTELMLKAREPRKFAAFLTSVCSDFMSIITERHGVFDKFTGDGVLAFFPEFFTGKDAAYYAIESADACHASFRRHYESYRGAFKSILADVGLGIGIDWGKVDLVTIAGGLTVVGEPVVYACRLSDACNKRTLANQPAKEAIVERLGAKCFVDETIAPFKHEGDMIAYEVKLTDREYSPAIPEWIADRKKSQNRLAAPLAPRKDSRRKTK